MLETLLFRLVDQRPKDRRFEKEFGIAVGPRNALAVNSCTAALHLAVEALGFARSFRSDDDFRRESGGFAFLGAIALLMDCDPSDPRVLWQSGVAVIIPGKA